MCELATPIGLRVVCSFLFACEQRTYLFALLSPRISWRLCFSTLKIKSDVFFSLGCILISLLLLLFLLSKTWGLGGVVVRRRRPWGRACLRCQATRAGAQPAPLGSLAFRWRRWRAHTRSVAMRFLRWWSTSWSTSRSTVSDTNTQSRSSVHRH